MNFRTHNLVNRISAYVLILFVGWFTLSPVQSIGQVWPLAYTVGGTDNDAGMSVIQDDSGYIYTLGYFNGSADFDPSTNVFSLTSVGGKDIFLSKMDKNKNFIWAKRMGGANNEDPLQLTFSKDKQLTIIGNFSGSCDFNPEATLTYTVSAIGTNDFFVLNLTRNGLFNWVKTIGGTGITKVQNIAVNGNGSYLLTGSFQGTVDFDPGAGVSYAISNGGYDAFILKLDSLGAFTWCKQIGGTANDYGNGIAVDASGNIGITGAFAGTIDFDPGSAVYNYTLSSTYSKAAYVLKLNATGNFIFVKIFEPNYWSIGVPGEPYSMGNLIRFDKNQNIISCGQFTNYVDFNPGTTVYYLSGGTPANYGIPGASDIYFSKLDSLGNFVWACGALAQYASSTQGGINVLSMDLDTNGAAYFSGTYYGPSSFQGFQNIGAILGDHLFWLAKVEGGGFSFVKNGGLHGNYNSVNGITLTKNQHILITGELDYPYTFQGNPLTTNNFLGDAFVIKLGLDGILPVKFGDFTIKRNEYGVLIQWETLTEINSDYFEIQRKLDNTEIQSKGRVKGSGNSLRPIRYSFQDLLNNRDFPANACIQYRIKQVDKDGQFTLTDWREICLDKDELNELQLYPNPASRSLTIATGASKQNDKIEIYTIQGELVLSLPVNVSSQTITVESLPPGMYFVTCGNSIKKFLRE